MQWFRSRFHWFWKRSQWFWKPIPNSGFRIDSKQTVSWESLSNSTMGLEVLPWMQWFLKHFQTMSRSSSKQCLEARVNMQWFRSRFHWFWKRLQCGLKNRFQTCSGFRIDSKQTVIWESLSNITMVLEVLPWMQWFLKHFQNMSCNSSKQCLEARV